MRAATLSTLLSRTPVHGRSAPRALFLSSYPPRECGIATFTEDVRGAYDALTGESSDVIAITEPGRQYTYPSYVIGEIDRDDPISYLEAARLANEHPADIVNIQHEFGLFGGERGAMLIEFLARLRKPAVLTLHTTVPDPDKQTRFVLRELCNRSDCVIALAYIGRQILERAYGIDPRKVAVVLHGVPDVPLRQSKHFKKVFGLEGKTVISTFGLLNRGKGIEYILDALPSIFARHPEAVYLLLGETHPEVAKREGESYRDSLLERVQQLGIGERLQFLNHYMSDDEVVAYLLATDVYVSPSLDPNQIVSGTLSYAVACGRAVVATEYLYATELLADGRGITVPFRDSGALAQAVNRVLDDPDLRTSIEVAAYRYGRQMTWLRVARRYQQAFAGCLRRPTRGEPGWSEALQLTTAGLGHAVGDVSSGAS